MKLENSTLDIIKGYTKASVICFILMGCAELDVNNPGDWEKLLPFTHFLDKAWLLPMNLMVDQTPEAQTYLNLTLSYRGSERQPPSILSLALQFSHLMTLKAENGQHPKEWNTEQRLRAIVDELHASDGFLSRWQIDCDKFKAINNMLVGTTKAARAAIAGLLNQHKWHFCAFTAELLRNSRWLCGASPTKTASNLKTMLTVTAENQVWFLKNHISTFLSNIRRVKQSARAKQRPTVQEWERLMDYTCVMYKVYTEAIDFHSGKSDEQHKCMNQVYEAFMSRPTLMMKTCLLNRDQDKHPFTIVSKLS